MGAEEWTIAILEGSWKACRRAVNAWPLPTEVPAGVKNPLDSKLHQQAGSLRSTPTACADGGSLAFCRRAGPGKSSEFSGLCWVDGGQQECLECFRWGTYGITSSHVFPFIGTATKASTSSRPKRCPRPRPGSEPIFRAARRSCGEGWGLIIREEWQSRWILSITMRRMKEESVQGACS